MNAGCIRDRKISGHSVVACSWLADIVIIVYVEHGIAEMASLA